MWLQPITSGYADNPQPGLGRFLGLVNLRFSAVFSGFRWPGLVKCLHNIHYATACHILWLLAWWPGLAGSLAGSLAGLGQRSTVWAGGLAGGGRAAAGRFLGAAGGGGGTPKCSERRSLSSSTLESNFGKTLCHPDMAFSVFFSNLKRPVFIHNSLMAPSDGYRPCVMGVN